MSLVTEFCSLELKPGVKVEDNPSLKETFRTISNVEGVKQVYWSRFIEDENKLGLAIDWESLEANKAYRATANYSNDVAPLKEVSSKLHHNHVVLKPSTDPLKSPIVEWMTAFFPSTTSAAEKDKYVANAEKFIAECKPAAKGFLGFAYGWVIEEVSHPKVDGKALAMVAVIGWESVEAHMSLRETDVFKENVALLRDGPLAITTNDFKFHVK